MKTLKIIIKGNVQGVFFRDFTQEVAKKLDINGWVQNRGDGSVEIRAQGLDSELGELIQKCYQGSSESTVESLTKNLIETDEIFEDFVVK